MNWKLNLLLNVVAGSIAGENPYSEFGMPDTPDDSFGSIIRSKFASFLGSGSGLGFGTSSSISTSTSTSKTSNLSSKKESGSGFKSLFDSNFGSSFGSRFDEISDNFFKNPYYMPKFKPLSFGSDSNSGFFDDFWNRDSKRTPKSPKKDDNSQLPKPKSKPKPSPNDFGKVIFSDDFKTFNHKNWQQARTASGGGNWEFQFYNDSRKTSFVEDGKLHIKPIMTSEYLGITDKQLMKKAKLDFITNDPKTNCTDDRFWGCFRETQGDNIINPVVSSQIRSINSFTFTYGKVDIIAKLPKGDWLWPAIWLMPKNENYGTWPASGEIDVVESRGNTDDCFGDGVKTVSSALHWGLDYQNNRYNLTADKYQMDYGDFSDGFHKFTLEWTPDYIRTWVDEKHLIMDVNFDESRYKLGKFTGKKNPWEGRGNNAPFDHEFYLIFNVAVGGTLGFFPDARDPVKDRQIYNKCKSKYDNNYKPFNNSSPTGPKDFLLNRNKWEPTWGEGDQSHMVIDSVRVTEYKRSRRPTTTGREDYSY